MKHIEYRIYETLTDEYLRNALARHPELRTVFGKIDPEEQPAQTLYRHRLVERLFVCREIRIVSLEFSV